MQLLHRIYVRFLVKSGFGYADYLKRNRRLHSQGEDCFISKAANIPDPYLTSIGDNVWITADCHLLCHDASVIMINRMMGGHLDRVAPIVIGDHCFLGNGVILLPGTSIGSRVIVGAGSLVTKPIPDNAVWAGSPARHISDFHTYVDRIREATELYPWKDLLKQGGAHVYDPELEVKLKHERRNFFFKDNTPSPS
jgi:acetyltransferase-like isoleucine patch superfamily enzyme